MLAAPGAGSARLSLRQPLVIYSRLDLNRMLLDRAGRAGAQIEKTRVLEMTRNGGNWKVRTTGGVLQADFCIVATGARNSLKNVGTRLTPADTMCALGYYVPGEQGHIDIQFLPQLEGYIWVFPRCGHLSVGICGKGVPAQELRSRLDRYMQEKQISAKDARFYSHLLPSLGAAGWRDNRVSGQGWLAVGDAAGLVDPITGEGIYYALRSGDLAGQVTWTHPSGGMYVWLSLPECINTGRNHFLFRRCVEKGVLYVPGEYCYASSPVPTNKIRLSYGVQDPASIREGVRRLAEAVREAMEKPAAASDSTARSQPAL
jgi:flavin-dependent dehydrogenase